MISSAKLLDKVSISGSPGSLRRPDVKSILVANVRGKKQLLVKVLLRKAATHRPLHPDGGRREDGGVVKVDDHICKFPLDLSMVHALTGGRDVCVGKAQRQSI